MRHIPRFTIIAAALLLGAATYCQTLPAGVQKVTSVEGITEYAYPNGLHVLLFPDTSKPKVTVNVTYLVGSRQEGYGETGMAHLLEHLMFRETKTRTNIKKELTDHGAQMNGSTAWDRTNYFETVTATDENLRWALELEADRMVNTRVEKEILDKEMTVVRNEFEMGENSPVNIMFERLLETAYIWHAYGHLPIGSRSDIENVPIDESGGVLPEVLPARRRGADHRRQVRPDHDAAVGGGHARPDSAAGAHAGGDLHGRAHAGWRALGDVAPRGKPAGGGGDVPRSGRQSSGFGGARSARRYVGRHARPAACTRLSSTARKPLPPA